MIDMPPGVEGFLLMSVLLVIISAIVCLAGGIIQASHPRTYIDDDGDRYGFGKIGHKQTIDQLLELDRRDRAARISRRK